MYRTDNYEFLQDHCFGRTSLAGDMPSLQENALGASSHVRLADVRDGLVSHGLNVSYVAVDHLLELVATHPLHASSLHLLKIALCAFVALIMEKLLEIYTTFSV